MKPLALVRSWLRSVGQELFETYFTFDPRALGLCRVGLGVLLFYDMWRRVSGIETWYSNDGLLPNHTSLLRPAAEYMFSFLFAASRTGEAAAMFVVCGVVFALFAVGYRTRLFHALSLACTVSLHSRAIFLENGGDVVLNVLCAWTLFLPMGARFSIDALRQSLAARRETTIDQLNDRDTLPRSEARPVASLAVLAILAELSLIYYLNARHKTGWTWHRGMAVHYVFYQERMVTWFGVWLREHAKPWMTMRLTYTTFNIELLAPILLLTPIVRVWARRLAIILMPGLHLAFAAALNLGQFSFNMIGFYPLLLGARDWDLLGRWLGPSPERARTIRFDERSPAAWALARLLVRLDAFGRLGFAARTPESEATWTVEDPLTGRSVTGAAALAQCAAALPCGRPVAALLDIGVAKRAIDRLGRAASARPRAAARWLAPLLSGHRGGTLAPSPARLWFRWWLAAPREAAAAVLAVALGSQVLVENKALSQTFKVEQTKWMQQIVGYGRLYQGWGMFSPDVPTGERMLYVDALTVTGRHVDPYNEAGSRVANLPVERIPPHMEQDEFWCDFTNRVPDRDTYWQALKEWIYRYPTRTGNPDDRILSFEAKLLEEEKPPPGEREPRNFKTKVMLRGWEPQ